MTLNYPQFKKKNFFEETICRLQTGNYNTKSQILEEQRSGKVWKIVEAKESRGKMNNMVIVYKMLRKFNFLCTTTNAIIILESGTSLFLHKDLVINKNFRIQTGYSKDFFFPFLPINICSFIGPKLLRMNFRVAPNKLQNFFQYP